MKIAIVGPGIMPIPPTGWGAVEILIWDYKETLEKLGHEVLIVNTPNQHDIINQCNNFNPDFVHIQYDPFWVISDRLNCHNVAITSHFGYLDQETKFHAGYMSIFNGFLGMKNAKIFALSESIKQQYTKHGFDENRVTVIPNGVRNDLFKFNKECEKPTDSVYLAKVDYRKRQHLFQNIPNLYFAGNIADHKYNKNNYLGEWSKDHLYENLTSFANLVLLSDGEAHPLVCLEAMSAGLGLVISEWATANLDTSLPFIDVIPENKINDIEFVTSVIEDNKKNCVGMREEIRQYVLDNFSWETIINDFYLPAIEK
tara:strand:- start:6807 stop:7745 length:939 start_codon:yes stop_codon:yes gene_type:complete